MNNLFGPGSALYPFRWFIVIATTLTLGMSYADYSGWGLFSSSGNPTRGYNGGVSGHK
jgi:hypothetical protein